MKVFYSQKMKANWWKHGDCNSAFFHSWVKKRVQTNRVYAVQDKNGMIAPGNDVAEAFIDYYKDLLGTGSHAAGDIQDHIIAVGPILQESHQIALTAPVMDDEIKNALWAVPGSKSLGSDGFTSKFYKDAWGIVGLDICLAVKDFFMTGKILRQINATTLTLLPKSVCPNSFKD